MTGNTTALGPGGGILTAGTVNLKNTIVAGNTASTGDPDVQVPFTSGGHNLIGDVGTATGLTDGAGGDIVGGGGNPVVDAKLGPLASGGGPTFTHLPLSDSPAIDAGDNTGATTTDQRGAARIIDGDGDGTPTVDIGAVEYFHGFLVNTFDDTVDANPGDGLALDAAGNTSLRAAVMEANAWAGDDVIALPAGTYVLTIAGAGEDAAATGDLDVNDLLGSLAIYGVGSDETIIDAGGDTGILDRVFDVFTGGLELHRLTVQGGRADGSNSTDRTGSGGGIFVDDGVFVLRESKVVDNEANRRGGGIFFVDNSVDTATITGSTIADNYAYHYGGGLFNTRNTVITESVITSNTADLYQGGGIYSSNSDGVTLTITDSSVTSNDGDDGGGISGSSHMVIERCLFSGNTANDDYGGGLRVTNYGPINTTISIEDSTFSNNTASQGGGIYNNARMTISRTTFTGNQATSTSDITGGGAIQNAGYDTSHMTLVGSTISANSATRYGGGILNKGMLYITNTTITENTSGGSYQALDNNEHAGGFTVLEIRNTIVADNVGDRDVGGTGFTSLGHNLIGNVGSATGFTDGVNGDIVGGGGNPVEDPKLGPLQDNGGPTFTHALLSDSPAVDAGDDTGVALTDQRGANRILDGDDDGTATVDIGAYEYLDAFFITDTSDTVDANPGDGIVADASGKATLRAAIMEANALVGDDVILLASARLRAPTTLPGTDEDAAATGDLDIAGSLTIIGVHADETIIDASQLDRVFEVLVGASLHLSGVTATGGYVQKSDAGRRNSQRR